MTTPKGDPAGERQRSGATPSRPRWVTVAVIISVVVVVGALLIRESNKAIEDGGTDPANLDDSPTSQEPSPGGGETRDGTDGATDEFADLGDAPIGESSDRTQDGEFADPDSGDPARQRFYFSAQSQDMSAWAPRPDSTWVTSPRGVPVQRLRRSKAVAQHAPHDLTGTSALGGGADVALIRLVSDPIAAQTVSGKVKGMVWSLGESREQVQSQLVMRVISGDGSTVRGTLRTADGGPIVDPWAANPAAHRIPAGWAGDGEDLSPVTAQSGDRLLVEIGFRTDGATNASSAQLTTSDSLGNDLSESHGDITPGDPWIELSQPVSFLPFDVGREVWTYDWSGADGDSWDPTLITTAGFNGEPTIDIQGNEGRIRLEPAEDGGAQMTLTGVDEPGGVDMVGKYRNDLTSPRIVYVVWAGSSGRWRTRGEGDTPDSSTASGLEFWNDDRDSKLLGTSAHGSDDKLELVGRNGQGPPPGTGERWFRFRHEPTDSPAKMWAKFWTGTEADEPPQWDMEWEPSNPDLGTDGALMFMVKHDGKNGVQPASGVNVYLDDWTVRRLANP